MQDLKIVHSTLEFLWLWYRAVTYELIGDIAAISRWLGLWKKYETGSEEQNVFDLLAISNAPAVSG